MKVISKVIIYHLYFSVECDVSVKTILKAVFPNFPLSGRHSILREKRHGFQYV